MHHHTVNVQVDNQIASLSYVKEKDYDKLRSHWSYAVENFNHILRARPFYRQCKICHVYPSQHDDKVDHDYVPVWDGRISFLKRSQIPAGLFWATYKEIEKETKIRFNIEKDNERIKWRSRRKWLRSEGKYNFQNKCVDELALASKVGTGGLILNATGSGKTRIAAMLASRLDCEILFIVDQLVLLKQAQEEISKQLNRKVGYVGNQKFKLERVTVATIQTLHLHRKDPKFRQWFKRVECIIIDEVHEALNNRNFSVINLAKPLSVFGLTATLGLTKKPIRLKAYSICGPILFKYPVQTGMQAGVLSRGICIQLEYPNQLHNLKGWTQQEAYRKRIVKNEERNYLIGSLTHKAIKHGKYVIIVVDRLLHLEKISSQLKHKKVKFKIVAGTYKGKGISLENRFKSKDKFEKGKIRCLLVNKVFQKGIDLKRVDLIINATAQPNSNKVIQIFGRGVRLHANKLGLIYIDIYDFDSKDKYRDKKNWLHKAAKRRIRALRKAGITIRKIVYSDNISSSEILKQSERWLQKEIKNGKV